MLDSKGIEVLDKIEPEMNRAAYRAFLSTFSSAGLINDDQVNAVKDTAKTFADNFSKIAGPALKQAIIDYIKSMQVELQFAGSQTLVVTGECPGGTVTGTATGPLTGTLEVSNKGVQ